MEKRISKDGEAVESGAGATGLREGGVHFTPSVCQQVVALHEDNPADVRRYLQHCRGEGEAGADSA